MDNFIRKKKVRPKGKSESLFGSIALVCGKKQKPTWATIDLVDINRLNYYIYMGVQAEP